MQGRVLGRLVMSAGVFLLVASRMVSAASMTIVEDGAPRATIVVTAAALEKDTENPAARKIAMAAQELQSYVEKISGARLPMVTDGQGARGNLILVGRSRQTDRLNIEIPSGVTPSRRDEGFTIVCRGNVLVLAGNNDGPYRGTEYAVYELLDRLGVRWFMPGEFGEIVPKTPTIRVAEMSLLEKPDFVMRNWWGHWTPPTGDRRLGPESDRWKRHNKMGGANFGGASDGSVVNIVPGPEYREEHPEYFAKNADGSPNFGVPSFTHPKAVEIAAEIIKKAFRNAADPHAYGFALGDGAAHDFSAETMKVHQGFKGVGWPVDDDRGISISEEWLTFVSNVAKEVRKEFPDTYIGTNGYVNREVPPQGVELDDHLVVMYAPIWSCTMHAYDDERCWMSVRQGQMLKRLCELS